MIADPGHRQIGKQQIVGPEAVEQVAVLRRDDDVAMREHDALGPAGRAGRVEHDADVGALALGDLVEPPAPRARIGAHLLAAQMLDVLEGMQVAVVVVLEANVVVVDDLGEVRQPVGDGNDLVDLLLVLDDCEFHLGVLEHVGHLVGNRVLVDGDGNAAEALDGGKGRIKARTVVADDGDGVAALDADLAQADGERAHLAAQLRPGPGLPDAEILVANGRAVSELPGIAQQELGHRIEIARFGGGRRRREGGAYVIHQPALLPAARVGAGRIPLFSWSFIVAGALAQTRTAEVPVRGRSGSPASSLIEPSAHGQPDLRRNHAAGPRTGALRPNLLQNMVGAQPTSAGSCSCLGKARGLPRPAPAC